MNTERDMGRNLTRDEMLADLYAESIVRAEAGQKGWMAEALREHGALAATDLSDEQVQALHFKWIRGAQIAG